MAKITRLVKSFSKLLLPILVLLILAVASASVWLVFKLSHAPKAVYLVTPEKYGQISARAAQVTAETWANRDGSSARGWLLKGSENAPAVILLHRYGADRSHVLNMGVKLSEATNFTVLMPDQRGHGENPLSKNSSFGGKESEDVISAIEYLQGLKTNTQAPLVGKKIGIYGVEMGAISAIFSAAQNPNISALAVDSVPLSSDDLLSSAVSKRFPFLSFITSKLAQGGTYIYYFDGSFKRSELCGTAKTIENRQVLLLGGADSPNLQESTQKIAKCFPETTKTEVKTDLNPSGINVINASLEQSESYEQRVIEFFRVNLGS